MSIVVAEKDGWDVIERRGHGHMSTKQRKRKTDNKFEP